MSIPGSPALPRDVGRRVAELRIARGWTQETFAECAEVSVGYVRQVEGGRENLTLDTLAKLAALLGVQVAELLVPPASRETERGRPRRVPSKEAPTRQVASSPAGPTVLDVQTLLATEEELEQAVKLAASSAEVQARSGVEWISDVRHVLHALDRAGKKASTGSMLDAEQSRAFLRKLRDLSVEFLAASGMIEGARDAASGGDTKTKGRRR